MVYRGTISRRGVLKAGAAALALPLAGFARPARARIAGADLLLVGIADLHSPYARLAQLVAAIERVVADNPGTDVRVLVNGDVFERGNVVALRSGGRVDLAALSTLNRIAPVIVNLGNHETAILDDMADFVRAGREAGITVISNLIDARTGALYADPATVVTVGDRRVTIAGLATDNIFTYRRPIRPTLSIPHPVEWAEATLPGLFAGTDLPVVMSHAGVAHDKGLLPLVPEHTLMIGGHDHLRFEHRERDGLYLHPGSWGNVIDVVAVRFEGAGPRFERVEVPVAPSDVAEPGIAAQIHQAMADHLAPEDQAVLGHMPESLDLPESILFAVEAVRDAAGADAAFLGHTTFGTGLEAGPVTRYAFDAYIRFDGDIRTAEVPGDVLATILARANQHRARSLAERTGDFVHALPITPAAGRTYTIAVNGWTAINQAAYLGTQDLPFAEVPDLRLKALVTEALPG